MTPLRSGELADLAGVSTDTLRYYERNRLLPSPPRTVNGYRCYPPEALARVQLIRRAIHWGFSVQELGRILKVRDSGGAPCKMVRGMAGNKLQQMERQIRDLIKGRRELMGLLRDWDRRLKTHKKDGQPARLLESIALRSSPSASIPRHK